MFVTSFSTIIYANVTGHRAPERLIYNGREYLLYNEFMYEYFKKYPEKRPKSPAGSDISITEDYIATYEIKNNELFLKYIGTRADRTIGGWLEASGNVSPEFLMDEQSALKIDWFSGFLVVPESDRRRKHTCASFRFPMRSSSMYENYILIEIKNGNFVKEIRMNCLEYQQFIDKQKHGDARTNQKERDQWYENRDDHTFVWEQHPEYLFYNSKEHILYSEPLYEYFKKHPEKRPKFLARSYNLIRGYIATYEIKNNELFLKNIGFHVGSKEHGEPVLESVLPESLTGQPELKIDWFSGFLIIPDGDIKKKYERKYASCAASRMTGGKVTSYYENYIIIEIKNGNFVRETRMNCLDYRKFRNNVFKEDLDLYDFEDYDKWCEHRGGCASRVLK